jgi:divalent metal cation (Fe/Co/Zn/Cd) transporter
MTVSKISSENELRSLYVTVGFYAIIVIIKLIAYFSTHADLQIKVAAGITIEEANSTARIVRQRVQSELNCLFCSIHPEP